VKIVVCGSMTFARQMVEAAEKLEKAGHTIVLPRHTKEYAEMKLAQERHEESVKNKISEDLICCYFNKIKDSDAVLIINCERHGVKNYIGGNSLLEMGFAHVLGKKIFLLNSMPEMAYKDEIIATQPIILNGDFSKISG